ncbi:MAG: hypothetical protein ACK522_03275 [Synechococcaceae cyanobacterium]
MASIPRFGFDGRQMRYLSNRCAGFCSHNYRIDGMVGWFAL